jgi:hypothetical protein
MKLNQVLITPAKRRRLWMLAIATTGGLVLAGLSVDSASATVQQTIYVSPSGADTNSGTISSPLLTLAGAKAKVATVNSSMTGDIDVDFRGGTYPFSAPVAFGASDSGSSGHTVYYQAYPGETPVFDGGTAVTGWTLYDSSKNIWVANLSRTTKLRSLYVNGQRQTLARSAGTQTAIGGSGTYSVAAGSAWALDSGSTYSGIQLSSAGLPSSFTNQGDLEIVNQDGFSFDDVGLSSVSTSGSTLTATLQEPIGAIALTMPIAWGSAFFDSTTLSNNHFYLQDAYELIDQPGEFYFDHSAGKLYYDKPSATNLSTASVIAPLAQQLMTIQGTSTSSRVHNISFSGLTVQHTDWSLLNVDGSYGEATVQSNALYSKFWSTGNWHTAMGSGSSGYANTTVMPAVVQVQNADDISFTGNTFTGLGAGALNLGNDTIGSLVKGNVFTDISGSAVTVGTPYNTYIGDGDFATGVEGVPTDDTISDNVIDRAAAEFLQTIPIATYYANGLTISHNEVTNAPYTAISMGWGFNAFYNDQPSGSKSTDAGDNSIDHNIIANSMTRLHDGGAIYTLGAQPGSVIQSNLIENTGGVDQGNPIYTDQSSSGIEISNNVIDTFNGTWWDVWGSDAHVSSLDVHDNSVTNAGMTEADLLAAGATATSTTILDNRLGWTSTAQATGATAGLESSFRSLRPAASPIRNRNTVEGESGVPGGRAIVSADSAASGGHVMAQLDTVGDNVSFPDVAQSDVVSISYASPNTGHIGIYVNGTRAASLAFASTGSWFGTYATASATVAVPTGATVQIKNATGDLGLNLDQITFTRASSQFIEPETGTLTGRAIECATGAATFDQNSVCQLDTVGTAVSFTSTNARTYLSLRYAANAGGTISVYVNGVDSGNVTFAGTGGWFTGWTRAGLAVTIPAGATIRIQNDTGDTGLNLDSVRLD